MWPTQVNYGPLGKIVFQKKNYIYSINLKILGPFLNFFLKIKPHFNSNYAKKKRVMDPRPPCPYASAGFMDGPWMVFKIFLFERMLSQFLFLKKIVFHYSLL